MNKRSLLLFFLAVSIVLVLLILTLSSRRLPSVSLPGVSGPSRTSGLGPKPSFGDAPLMQGASGGAQSTSPSGAINQSPAASLSIPSQKIQILPETVPVFRYLPTPAAGAPDSLEQVSKQAGQRVADSFGIAGYPTRLNSEMLSWSDDTYQVLLETPEGLLPILRVYGLTASLELPAPSVSAAVQVVESFLLDSGLLLPGLEVGSTYARVVAIEPHGITDVITRERPANAVYVPIVRIGIVPDLYPLLSYPRYAVITGDGEMYSFAFSYQPLDSEVGEYNAVPFETIRARVEQGGYPLLFLDGEEHEMSVVGDVAWTDVLLVMSESLIPSEPYLRPAYQLRGEAQLTDGTSVSVAVSIPALGR